MIERLSIHHEQWERIANNICKDSFLAKDLTQDMYLKLHECKSDVPDSKLSFFVAVVLRNLYIDHIKSEKKRGHVSIDNFYTLESDEEIDHIEQEKEYSEQLEKFNDMYWLAQKYFKMNQEMSLRDMGKELKTNYMYIYRVMKKAKINING